MNAMNRINRLLAALLLGAGGLAPLAAAHAQNDPGGGRGGQGAERPLPRGPELRQMDRRDAPRGEWRQRGEWRGAADRADPPRANPAQPPAWGRPDGGYDRNRDGRIDRRWDRNGNGEVDRRWDRNGNGRVDRQWDRNRDGALDRRWDRNGDGRVDRYRYDGQRFDNRGWRDDRRYDNRGWRDDRRYDNRVWNRGWRDDRRYDWQGYRRQYGDRFHLNPYYAPYRDHRYSRFSIGVRIGSPFYSNRYWIADPWRYRLPNAYAPYRWVRYYDDVLLVDTYSGRVVDVLYNFFW